MYNKLLQDHKLVIYPNQWKPAIKQRIYIKRLSDLQNLTYMPTIFRTRYIVAVFSFLSFDWIQMALANFTPPVGFKLESFSSATFLQPRPILASWVMLTCLLTFHAGVLFIPIKPGVYQVVCTMVNRVVIKTRSASSSVLCQHGED